MRTIPILVLISLAGEAGPAKAADYWTTSPTSSSRERICTRLRKLSLKRDSVFTGALGEQALLKYEGPGKYQIIWEDHSTCEVEKVVALERSSNNPRQAGVNFSGRDAVKAAILSHNPRGADRRFPGALEDISSLPRIQPMTPRMGRRSPLAEVALSPHPLRHLSIQRPALPCCWHLTRRRAHGTNY